jgi:adenosylcobinamide-phosphate synthase
VGLLAGALADALFADPARWHPVAGFGSCAVALERRWYADRRAAGAAHTAVLVGGVVGLGVAAEVVGRGHPVAHTCLTAAATWAVLGGTSLAAHGTALADALEGESGVCAHRVGDVSTARSPQPQGESRVSPRRVGDVSTARPPRPQGESRVSPRRVGDVSTGAARRPNPDLAAARALIPALCGRDPEALDAAGMARAGTESMAENTSDAAVAPLLWGAVAGIPGLLGYRAINTLDAMVGYRSPRYVRFGWAAARTDDLVNLVPSRVTALLLALLAPTVGGSPSAATTAWRRDAAKHPSPNAGPVEAAAAGALGVALGGPTAYPHGVENRPRLGRGRPPTSADLRRAARLSQFVGAAATLLACALTRLPRRRP